MKIAGNMPKWRLTLDSQGNFTGVQIRHRRNAIGNL